MRDVLVKLLSAMALLLAVAALSGCSKSASVEDICAKLAEGDEVAECTEELTRELEECADRDAAMECMSGAESENDVEACFSHCVAEGGE